MATVFERPKFLTDTRNRLVVSLFTGYYSRWVSRSKVYDEKDNKRYAYNNRY